MTKTLTLTVTTPLAVAIAEHHVASIRAEDESGGFGIWPGHTDFLTVLGASVLRWRTESGPWRFCALRGGVLQVDGGSQVRIACREAVPGESLAKLEGIVHERRATSSEAVRIARGEWTRLHATVIRGLMRQLGTPGGSGDIQEEDFR